MTVPGAGGGGLVNIGTNVAAVPRDRKDAVAVVAVKVAAQKDSYVAVTNCPIIWGKLS